jgi:glycosyltransferase involved in cell wall biosynthesis
MPNILLEAMASGLPIASSDRGPMPEILKDGGVYFNPENIHSISGAINKLFQFKGVRVDKSNLAFKYSQEYTWERCANSTFSFISKSLRLNK